MIPDLRSSTAAARARSLAARSVSAVALATLTGCAAMNPASQECVDPDRRLAQALAPIPPAHLDGPLCASAARGEVSCGMIRQRVNQLANLCPRHAPTVLAAASLAYDGGSISTAQQYLDDLLSWAPAYPEAVMLRSRLALQDGNLRLARRLLEQEIQRVPNHPGLREMLASLLYLQRQYAEARATLEIAGRLGAPGWRLSYNLGLVEEGLGNDEIAERHYAATLDARPDYGPARVRLEALRAGAAPRPRP